MSGDPDFEAMASTLEATGDYRILRRLQPRPTIDPAPGTQTRVGLAVDVETTGLDPSRDEIIELAMTPFIYGLEGTIYAVGESFEKFRDPGRPIPPEITTITGIDDSMVAGQSIASEEVAAFVEPAAIVIAHNAAFDRRFLERFCGAFTTKPWACSMTQIDWASEGYEGTKLAYLANATGFFYTRHRAMHDCLATIELLGSRLPKSDGLALGKLLDVARRPTWRIWAENSPFELKDFLKARGYRWNDGAEASPRAWWIDVAEDQREAEQAYLRKEVYGRDVDLLVTRITAFDRFSSRAF